MASNGQIQLSKKQSENEMDEEFDQMGKGTIQEEFKERKEVLQLISQLEKVHHNQIETELIIERFTSIVDSYQEQPHLLDSHMEEFINKLLEIVRNKNVEFGHMHLAFKFLYLLSKLRGYKIITRWLPHEVSDLEPVLSMLKAQNLTDHKTWEIRYCLLLWLSMVAMIPFDLKRLDYIEAGNDETLPIMDRILNILKSYIQTTDKTNDAAAFTLAKFLTRPDVRDMRMAATIDWVHNTLQSSLAENKLTSNAATRGVLFTMALLFKNSKREEVIPYAQKMLMVITQHSEIKESSNTIIRKLGVKVIQRIGLVFLKTRVASWRYNRGSRSLAENLRKGTQAGMTSSDVKPTEEAEDYDVPDEIEDVIDHLLGSLKDLDTIVRWSAAKGIGRISNRLPKDLADEVFGAVLQLFSYFETDNAWHGACLSLGELGRRGLVLPERLPDVVPLILKSLAYDEKRVTVSVGSHVRDAACYVCWAFARAYEPSDLTNYVNTIASALVAVSIFDREVNVRRAASAAFQENVGRQGTFPHGIDILTTCDYFAVGNRVHCYTKLSKFVAQFPEYRKALIDHLMEKKVGHWDMIIRNVTAKALFSLTEFAVEYVSLKVLPELLPLATGPDLNSRHGSILAIGKICHALYLQTSTERSLTDMISKDVQNAIKSIVPQLREKQYLQGYGGELVKRAVCEMITDVAQAGLPFHNQPVIEEWQTLLGQCLQHFEVSSHSFSIQEAAIEALPQFLIYYITPDGTVPTNTQETIIENYIEKVLHAGSVHIRQGFSQALGALPQVFLSGKLSQVLSTLICVCGVTGSKDESWAMARMNACKAIDRVCQTVGVNPSGSADHCICADNFNQVYDCFIRGLHDYTLDSRGDIGAWVREASMTGLQNLILLVINYGPELYSRDRECELFPLLCQQACEKIDRTRAHAGSVLTTILYYEPLLNNIPNRSVLEKLFPKDQLEHFNFAAPIKTFHKFCELIAYPAYTYHVLLGFSISVGGLTESLVKHSHLALLRYLKSMKSKQLQSVCDALLLIYSRHVKVDRVSIPLMEMTKQLLFEGIFKRLQDEDRMAFADSLLMAVKKEVAKSSNPQKIMIGSDVLCGLVEFTEVTQKCLSQLVIYLCHRYPRIRKSTAEKLFEILITSEELVPAEHSDEAMSILSDTSWDDEISSIKPIRNRLCDLLEIPHPVGKAKN